MDNDVIIFLLAFILLLKENDLQVVPFEFELIIKQPLLNKFDKQDWEAALLHAVAMDNSDKVYGKLYQGSKLW